MNKRGIAYGIAFLGTIIAANLAITHVGLVPVGFGLLAPAGVYFAGLGFALRDGVQEELGGSAAVALIVTGGALSWLLGTGPVAVASAVAFLFSELADLFVYTSLRRRGLVTALVASNIIGLIVDSAIFLWLAFGSLSFLAGQVVGKAWMTALVAVPLLLIRRRRVA